MGDCITYDYYVRLGLPEYLFNPHHIGFDWLGDLFYKILKEKGYTGSVMNILQIRNLLFSSIGLALFFFFMFKISKKYILSLLTVTCISFTAAYWMYSQINDTPIIHSVIVFTLCFVALYFPYSKHKILYAILIGVLHGINIFFHQYDALFIIPLFFVIVFGSFFIPDEDRVKNNFVSNEKVKLGKSKFIDCSNLKYFFVYLITFAVIVCSGYYYVGVVKLQLTFNKNEATSLNNIKDANYFFNWLILYAKINHWGKGLEKKGNLAEDVAKGVTTYFFHPGSFTKRLELDFNSFTKSEKIIVNLILVMFIAILIMILFFLPALYKKYGYAVIYLLIYMVVYTLFSMWWEPYYREFYVATIFAYWLFLFLGFNFVIDKFKLFSRVIIYPYLFLFCFLLFIHNFTVFIYPNAGKNFRTFDIMKVELNK